MSSHLRFSFLAEKSFPEKSVEIIMTEWEEFKF